MKKAKFEPIAAFSCQRSASELCSALKAAMRGHCAHRRSAASERAPRGAGLAAKMLEVYGASRRACGPPKAFRALKRGGGRVSRKRAAGTMRENGRRGVTRRCARNPEKERPQGRIGPRPGGDGARRTRRRRGMGRRHDEGALPRLRPRRPGPLQGHPLGLRGAVQAVRLPGGSD